MEHVGNKWKNGTQSFLVGAKFDTILQHIFLVRDTPKLGAPREFDD
jgi:hypothetical protein